MVRRRPRERSWFEVRLPDGHKLWPDWLRRIDTLLEDEAVIETVAQGLEKRWPETRDRNRRLEELGALPHTFKSSSLTAQAAAYCSARVSSIVARVALKPYSDRSRVWPIAVAANTSVSLCELSPFLAAPRLRGAVSQATRMPTM